VAGCGPIPTNRDERRRKVPALMGPIHTAWAVSIALKTILALLARGYFRIWLIFCIAGSLIAWWTPDAWYSTVWMTKSLLLIPLNAFLVYDACRGMHRIISLVGFLLCAAGALGVHIVATTLHPRIWPDSPLEPVEAGCAMWSCFLGLVVMLAIAKAVNNAAFWNGRVLFSFLLFDSLNLYNSASYSLRIGINVGLATSVCYLAWIVVWAGARVSERRLRVRRS
jgi:hypothetical protein